MTYSKRQYLTTDTDSQNHKVPASTPESCKPDWAFQILWLHSNWILFSLQHS